MAWHRARRRIARHANACAARLAAQVADLPGLGLMFPVEANAVCLSAPPAVLNGLRAGGQALHTFIGDGARFMFAWDAQAERVDDLAAAIRALVLPTGGDAVERW